MDEIPCDFVRKCLSVVVADATGSHSLVTKGALDHVLAMCTRAGADAAPLDARLHTAIEARFEAWSEQGYRVLGVASRLVPARSDAYTRDDEQGLNFDGFLLFMDPPKVDAGQTIRDLAQRGVQLKIITGDNHKVAQHVATALKLPVADLITGSELNATRLISELVKALASETARRYCLSGTGT